MKVKTVARFKDHTRSRIFSLIEAIVSDARDGVVTTGVEFHMSEDDIKRVWRKRGLITELQENLGDSLNPIVAWLPMTSCGQISVRKVHREGGLRFTINALGARD